MDRQYLPRTFANEHIRESHKNDAMSREELGVGFWLSPRNKGSKKDKDMVGDLGVASIAHMSPELTPHWHNQTPIGTIKGMRLILLMVRPPRNFKLECLRLAFSCPHHPFDDILDAGKTKIFHDKDHHTFECLENQATRLPTTFGAYVYLHVT